MYSNKKLFSFQKGRDNLRLSKTNYITAQYYLHNEYILQMKNYKHHSEMTTYDHCVNVMYKSCRLVKKLHFTDDQIRNLIVGCMLHDFYLYDFHHNRKQQNGIHAWSHPVTALKNAEKHFDLNERQKNIIRSHMYPTCLLHPPRYKEAWLVAVTDKYCALEEYIKCVLKNNHVLN